MTRRAWQEAEKQWAQGAPMTPEERDKEVERIVREAMPRPPSGAPQPPPLKKKRRKAGPQTPD